MAAINRPNSFAGQLCKTYKYSKKLATYELCRTEKMERLKWISRAGMRVGREQVEDLREHVPEVNNGE